MIHHPLPPMPPNHQQTFKIAIPLPDKMLPILPILTAQPVLFPPQIPATSATESTQILLQSLQTQLEFTKTLIDHLGKIIMPNNVSTPPRILSPTLFDFIVQLPPNESFTLLTP